MDFEQILPFSHKFLTPNAKSLIFKTEDNVPLGKLLEKLWKKYFFVAKEEAKEFLTKVSPEDLYNVFVKVRYFTFIACRTYVFTVRYRVAVDKKEKMPTRN